MNILRRLDGLFKDVDASIEFLSRRQGGEAVPLALARRYPGLGLREIEVRMDWEENQRD